MVTKGRLLRGIVAIGLVFMIVLAAYKGLTVSQKGVSENSRELFHFPSAKIGNTTAPAIDFFFSVTFAAEGDISADNTVGVHVLVVSSSVPNFPKYYSGIAFTDATGYNSTDPSVLQPLVWQYQTNGSYVANGKLRWEASGPTWVILVPNAFLLPNPFTVRYYLLATANRVESTMPIRTIDDSSHTPSLNGVDTMISLGWGALGVGALAALVALVFQSQTPRRRRRRPRNR
jgi:hypothetical protein